MQTAETINFTNLRSDQNFFLVKIRINSGNYNKDSSNYNGLSQIKLGKQKFGEINLAIVVQQISVKKILACSKIVLNFLI